MKKVYVEPIMEFKKYQIEDIITTSSASTQEKITADIVTDTVAGEGIESALVYNSFFG